MDFNVSEYEKFTDAILDSTLKLTLRYYLLSRLGIVSKNIHNYLKQLLQYFSLSKTYVRPDFLYIH